MKRRYWMPFLTAAVGGVYLSVMYVNPYSGSMTLSEMVLQLSGSRGSFAMGFSYAELAAFAMRLFPAFIFELYAGIMLYQYFCTASVYVFSRYPHRTKWYMKEVCYFGSSVCIFHFILLVVIVLTTKVRYELFVDSAGIMLMTYHFLLYSLWVYTMSLSVNLIAVYVGSNTAYVWVVAVQFGCIVVLNVIDWIVRYYEGRFFYEDFLIWNPIAHLVLGWHSNAHRSSYMQAELNDSLITFLVLGVVVTAVGAAIIEKHDLLVSDLEKGAA